MSTALQPWYECTMYATVEHSIAYNHRKFLHILYLLKPLNNSKVYISRMSFEWACTETTFTNFDQKFGYFCFNLEPYYPHNSYTVRDRENIIMKNVSVAKQYAFDLKKYKRDIITLEA